VIGFRWLLESGKGACVLSSLLGLIFLLVMTGNIKQDSRRGDFVNAGLWGRHPMERQPKVNELGFHRSHYIAGRVMARPTKPDKSSRKEA